MSEGPSFSHPWSTERDRFLALVLASHLLDLRGLTEAVEGLPASGEITQLCEHLIAKGALTKWQCEKLRVGKHKGFFQGEFKLLDCGSESDIEPRRCLAEECKSGRKVTLLLTRNDALPRGIEYRVIDDPRP